MIVEGFKTFEVCYDRVIGPIEGFLSFRVAFYNCLLALFIVAFSDCCGSLISALLGYYSELIPEVFSSSEIPSFLLYTLIRSGASSKSLILY